MDKCRFDSTRPINEIFTYLQTYKEVGTYLIVAVGINTLGTLLLGGSKKQAVLLGASTALVFEFIHFAEHRFNFLTRGYSLFASTVKRINSFVHQKLAEVDAAAMQEMERFLTPEQIAAAVQEIEAAGVNAVIEEIEHFLM